MSDEAARPATHGALAVGADGTGYAAPPVLLDMMRQLRACERSHLASLLHDGPVQQLAALALELGEVRAMGAPGDELDDITRQVHAVGRELCRLQDELWPFPWPGSGLIETLKQRTAWLLLTPLAVAVGEGVTGLPQADIQTVGDVTELILTGLGQAEAWDRPVVMVRARPDLIFLELNMRSAPGYDPASGGSAAVEAWLHRLAAAIQARARVGFDDNALKLLAHLAKARSVRRRPERSMDIRVERQHHRQMVLTVHLGVDRIRDQFDARFVDLLQRAQTVFAPKPL